MKALFVFLILISSAYGQGYEFQWDNSNGDQSKSPLDAAQTKELNELFFKQVTRTQYGNTFKETYPGVKATDTQFAMDFAVRLSDEHKLFVFKFYEYSAWMFLLNQTDRYYQLQGQAGNKQDVTAYTSLRAHFSNMLRGLKILGQAGYKPSKFFKDWMAQDKAILEKVMEEEKL